MNKIYLALLLIIGQLASYSDLSAECRIGLLISTTGEYASGGEECLLGHQVAEERYQAKKLPIRFILEDSRAQGKESVNLFKKLVNVDQVQVVELVRSPVGMAVNPLSKNLEIPILGAVGHPKFITENPYAYQFWPSIKDETAKLAKIIKQDGVGSIYSLTTEDDWLLAFQDGLIENYTQLGGRIIAKQNVEPSFVDFRSLILKIKQSKAESVFFGLGPNQLGIFIKQFREAGLTQRIYSTFMVKFEDVIKALSPELLNLITFVEIDSMKVNFLSNYQKISNNRLPSAISYSCYLASEAIYQACEGYLETKQSFHSLLSKLSTIETLDQTIKISDRSVSFDIIAKELKAGKIVNLHYP